MKVTGPMLKLFMILGISLVAAVPATALYVGILSVLKPLLDKIRASAHSDLVIKSHGA